MNIIGISAYYHDSAATILCDGEIVAAAQEERFTRIKHDESFLINSIKFSRGLKYFLEGFKYSQKEIQNFVDECKKNECKDGFISKNFYQFCLNKSYKFRSGPFVDKIFKIIKLEEKKINILIGNLKTTVNKEDFSYSAV